jgi:hypothetical protein
LLPDADQVPRWVAERRDPQIALRIRRRHDLSALRHDLVQRRIDPVEGWSVLAQASVEVAGERTLDAAACFPAPNTAGSGVRSRRGDLAAVELDTERVERDRDASLPVRVTLGSGTGAQGAIRVDL